jgi:hypothetical protein
MGKKILSLFMTCLLALNFAYAKVDPQPVNPNEGMWLPHLIKLLNIDDMKKLGFQLSAEDLYSVNKSSIKDAVVQLGGFCTAEVVSPEGLLFTNHHCGYDAIATHSSVENDYLTDGFWAKSKSEELANEGLTVSFLVRIEDVTKKIADAVANAGEGEEEMAMQEAIGKIEADATEGNDYRAQIKDIYAGNQQLLFIYEVFRDVRLVGAPPSAIGKFGGDTDNWMWPRHTGDFSVFRVYADKDNKPADYSADNVPYQPKHFLPVSIKGLEEGDFAMTLGYPGSTDRYLSSYAIDHIYKNDNPAVIKVLGERLRIMHEDMMASTDVRIKLASSYASLSNYHKYCIGQNRGLRTRGLVEERQNFEKDFSKWVSGDSKRKEKYGEVLDMFKQNYASNTDVLKLRMYINTAGFGPGIVAYGVAAWRLKTVMEKDEDSKTWEAALGRITPTVDEHFEEYVAVTDQKVLAATMRMMFTDLPEKFHPATFTSKAFKKMKPKGDKDRFDMYAEKIFSTSMLTDKERLNAFLAKPSLKAIQKDLGVSYVEDIINVYRNQLAVGNAMFEAVDGEAMKLYQAAMQEMMPNHEFYPDANSTMRMSYGKVIPYDPRDGVSYKFMTFGEGVLEKEIPGDEEFNVPQGVHDLLVAKDYGRYADKKTGRLPLCFLTDNDITGGNSGSPVINGKGELIGIAFDGNWESMTSDLVFDESVVRTISVDIRYVLWTIDKYAGATNLIKELKITQ